MRAAPTILHLDMDAFYASVEQASKPSLRGKAVIVGGLGPRGVVATASYEARRFGVHSAMPMAQARRLCPNGACLVPRFSLYREVSDTVMGMLRELSPLVEPLSLDEAFVDLEAGGVAFDAETARAVGERLRADITAVTGLSGSVGLAGSKMLAKVASEEAKPAGLLLIEVGTERAHLAPMSVRTLPGVGPATGEHLRRAGITTVGELAAAGEDELVRIVGRSHGVGLYRMALGVDERPVVAERDAKSVSVEDTFDVDLHDRVRIRTEVQRLADRCVERLRGSGHSGRTIVLKVRRYDFSTLTRSETLRGPTDDPVVVREAAARLLEAVDTTGGVRLLGVGVTGLADYTQEDLFAFADAMAARAGAGGDVGPGPDGDPGPGGTSGTGVDRDGGAAPSGGGAGQGPGPGKDERAGRGQGAARGQREGVGQGQGRSAVPGQGEAAELGVGDGSGEGEGCGSGKAVRPGQGAGEGLSGAAGQGVGGSGSGASAGRAEAVQRGGGLGQVVSEAAGEGLGAGAGLSEAAAGHGHGHGQGQGQGGWAGAGESSGPAEAARQGRGSGQVLGKAAGRDQGAGQGLSEPAAGQGAGRRSGGAVGPGREAGQGLSEAAAGQGAGRRSGGAVGPGHEAGQRLREAAAGQGAGRRSGGTVGPGREAGQRLREAVGPGLDGGPEGVGRSQDAQQGPGSGQGSGQGQGQGQGQGLGLGPGQGLGQGSGSGQGQGLAFGPGPGQGQGLGVVAGQGVGGGDEVVGRRWSAGSDVRHAVYGPGWVQGSGVGRVTVRFEQPGSEPGRVRTFMVDDPELEPSDPMPLVGDRAASERA